MSSLEEKSLPTERIGPAEEATKPPAKKMATIEDEDERLLNQIGYAQVNAILSVNCFTNLCRI
jgi:hypothetical protein